MSTRSQNDRENTRKNAGGSQPPRRGKGREEERKPGFSSMAMVLPMPVMSVPPPSSLSMPKSGFGRTVNHSPLEQKIKRKDSKLQEAGERWNVIEAPELPWFPLEKTFKIDLPSNIVAERIDLCLQGRSIFAEFDSENAVATCMTGCYTKFKVSLFKTGDEGEATIVEVQNRRGCPLAFRKERTAIINAAKGIETPKSKPLFLPIPDSVMSHFKPHPKDELKSMLLGTVKQLQTGKRDEQLMTLRNLACMTDIEKSNQDSCKKMCKIFLEPDVGIRKIITSILEGQTIDQVHNMIRNAVHQIMINVFSVLAMEGSLSEVIHRDESWFTKELFPHLVEDIKHCNCIHNACLSSKCLSILFHNSSIILAHAKSTRDLMGVLQEAVARGNALHQKLHDEAQGTINALQCQ
eukprot:CAMPEP_0204643158 /NCGR_PEP_ID=MMETSP0718-20130828/468_1 /ASSEMBLY_ACC=CAM_ASM_000674 /TAXON_ID=230516 /ORGANISM="Chaetoceros curvisetus" /LENGTH=406 /DNA_ID=CAMNT_0051664257 /DNA_START=266 /DNA_END=1486 /DNA_ORIENTATION=+